MSTSVTARLPTSLPPRQWRSALLGVGYLGLHVLLDASSFIEPVLQLGITPWSPYAGLMLAYLCLQPRGAGWVLSAYLLAELLIRGVPEVWWILPLPALAADSTAEAPSTLQVQTLQKILGQAETNLQGVLRWMGEATTGALPDERKLELFGAHSRIQRSAKVLIVQSNKVAEASWSADAQRFVSEYFDFSQALGKLHRSIVLGEDASAPLEQSRVSAQVALQRLRELKALLEQK